MIITLLDSSILRVSTNPTKQSSCFQGYISIWPHFNYILAEVGRGMCVCMCVSVCAFVRFAAPIVYVHSTNYGARFFSLRSGLLTFLATVFQFCGFLDGRHVFFSYPHTLFVQTLGLFCAPNSPINPLSDKNFVQQWYFQTWTLGGDIPTPTLHS
jgi:hypothetical protein